MIKKHPILIAILGVFALACLSGISLAVLGILDNGKTQKSIDKNAKDLKVLTNRSGSFALSEANVEAANENVKRLERARVEKFTALVQLKRVDSTFASDSTEFGSLLKGYQQSWTKSCADKEVILDSDAASFGFSRYLNDNEPIAAPELRRMDTQARVVGKVLELLQSARDTRREVLTKANVIPAGEKTLLRLVAIRREAFELAPEKRRALKRDEFVVTPDESVAQTGLVNFSDGSQKTFRYLSLRRPEIMNALGVQFEFIGDSGTLREFLRDLSNYSIYVRDIRAVRARPEQVPGKAASPAEKPAATSGASADPFSFFSGASGASAPSTTPAAPVVPIRVIAEEGLPEVFTVTLEYIAPLKFEKKEPEKK